MNYIADSDLSAQVAGAGEDIPVTHQLYTHQAVPP